MATRLRLSAIEIVTLCFPVGRLTPSANKPVSSSFACAFIFSVISSLIKMPYTARKDDKTIFASGSLLWLTRPRLAACHCRVGQGSQFGVRLMGPDFFPGGSLGLAPGLAPPKTQLRNTPGSKRAVKKVLGLKDERPPHLITGFLNLRSDRTAAEISR